MREWLRFFAGTPQRFLGTLIGCFVLGGILFPDRAVGGLKMLVTGAWNEVFVPLFQVLMPVALFLAIIYIGFRALLRAISGGGKK